MKNSDRTENIASQIIIPVVICLLVITYLSVSYSYPFYFVRDMDYFTIVDTVMIHSGYLPDHIPHPGFGMYFFLYFTQKLAYCFKYLSVVSLNDILLSLNPISGIAELTVFGRLHTVFLAIGIVLLLWMSLRNLFKPSFFPNLAMLVLLGCQGSLIYQASMIRPELYAVFFWCAAIFLIMTFFMHQYSHSKYIVLLIVAGIFLGLSFLTKIQALIYLIAFPLIISLGASLAGKSEELFIRNLTRRSAIAMLCLSVFNLIIFSVFLYFAYSIMIPGGFFTCAVKYSLNSISKLFIFILSLICIVQSVTFVKNNANSLIFQIGFFFNIIFVGFLLSFTLHLLLPIDWIDSLKYTLYDGKILFFRSEANYGYNNCNPSELSFYYEKFINHLFYNPSVFFLNVILNLIIISGYRFKYIEIRKNQLNLCIFLTLLAFVNAIIATRFNLRDFLWIEILFNFLSLFYFMIILTRTIKFRAYLFGFSSILLIIAIVFNMYLCIDMSYRINANFHNFGWKPMFSNLLQGNQRKYGEIMSDIYAQADRDIAVEHAIKYDKIRKTVSFVFSNLSITHRNIGIISENYPVWSFDKEYRFSKIPEILEGAILVDTTMLPLKNKIYYEPEYVRDISDRLDKFKKVVSAKHLSVLNRNDLQIFLFLNKDDISSISDNYIIPKDDVITVAKEEEKEDFFALEITNYSEIPVNKIKGKYFFAIKNRFVYN